MPDEKASCPKTCPTCGDVVLTTGEVGLLQRDEGVSQFLFVCPTCHRQCTRDIPAGIVHILLAAGVHPVESMPELISQDQLTDFLADFEQVAAPIGVHVVDRPDLGHVALRRSKQASTV